MARHPYKRIYIQRQGFREHRIIAERALGHPLPVGAEVHHVDGNKKNNVNSNLVICENRKYHSLLHMRQRIVRVGGDPDVHRICSSCKRLLAMTSFNKNKAAYGDDGLCKQCKDCCVEYQRALRKKAKA